MSSPTKRMASLVPSRSRSKARAPLLRDERPLLRTQQRARARAARMTTQAPPEFKSQVEEEQHKAELARANERVRELEAENMELTTMEGNLRQQLGQLHTRMETLQKHQTTTAANASARLRELYHQTFEEKNVASKENELLVEENEMLKVKVSRLEAVVEDLDETARSQQQTGSPQRPSSPQRHSPSRLESRQRHRFLQEQLQQAQAEELKVLKHRLTELEGRSAEAEDARTYLQEERDNYRRMLDDAHRGQETLRAEKEDLHRALEEMRRFTREERDAKTQQTTEEARHLKVRLKEAQTELGRTHDQLTKSMAVATAAEQRANNLKPYERDLMLLLSAQGDEQDVWEEVQRLRSKYKSEAVSQHTTSATRPVSRLRVNAAVSTWDDLLDQAEQFAQSCQTLDQQRLDAIHALSIAAKRVDAPTVQHRNELVRELQRLARPDVPNPILDNIDEILRLERQLAVADKQQKKLEQQYHQVAERCKPNRPHFITCDGTLDLLAARLRELETANAAVRTRPRLIASSATTADPPHRNRRQHRQ